MAWIIWNVNPDIVHLGPLVVRWYGVFFALLFWLGYLLGQWIWKSEGKSTEDLNSLLVYIIVGTIVGARLGHCLFYEPAYYFRHPLEILKVWQGGLASHGGVAGVMIALWVYARKHPDQPYLWLVDRAVLGGALGGVFIRLGNLFNSEILGRETTVPWAFVFPREDLLPRHPVQLYEATAYALIFLLLLGIYRRFKARTPRGMLLGLFLATAFAFRFGIEFLKERQASYEQGFAISVGQWLSLPFVAAGLILLWRSKERERPGAHPLNRVV